jgi:hypothetical protein
MAALVPSGLKNEKYPAEKHRTPILAKAYLPH